MFSRLIVYTICLALCSCTVLRPLSEAAVDRQLVAGDALRVTFNDGSKRELTVVAVEPDFFTALPTHSKTTLIEEFRFSDVSRIERREPSTERTLLLVVVIVGVAYAVIWAENWEFVQATAL